MVEQNARLLQYIIHWVNCNAWTNSSIVKQDLDLDQDQQYEIKHKTN